MPYMGQREELCTARHPFIGGPNDQHVSGHMLLQQQLFPLKQGSPSLKVMWIIIGELWVFLCSQMGNAGDNQVWKIPEVISPLIIGVCFLVTSFSVYSFKAQLFACFCFFLFLSLRVPIWEVIILLVFVMHSSWCLVSGRAACFHAVNGAAALTLVYYL